MSDSIERQYAINQVLNLIPSSVSTGASEIVMSNELFFLSKDLGDYALQFALYSTNHTYETVYFGFSDPLGNTTAIEISRWENALVTVDDNTTAAPLVVSEVSNPDIVLQDTESPINIDAGFLAVKLDMYSSEDVAKGFLSQVTFGSKGFADVTIGRGQRHADLAVHLEKQRILPVDLYDVELAVEDSYNTMKQHFPSLQISLSQYSKKVQANLLYGDLADNYNVHEASAVVVYQVLNGENPADTESVGNVEAINQIILDAKADHAANNTLDGFTGYEASASLSGISQTDNIEQPIIDDEIFIDTVKDSSNTRSVEDKITQVNDAVIKIERLDGETEEIIFNPTARQLQNFENDVADVKTNGTLISQTTEVITNPDGSVINKTIALRVDAEGNGYSIVLAELAEGSLQPANGFRKTELITRTSSDGTVIIGTEQKTTFVRNGQEFETTEFQKDPEANWSIRQKITNPDGTIQDDGPLFVVPSTELLSTLQFTGSTLGGVLANHLAEDNVYQGIVYSAVLKTIGSHFGTFSAFLAVGGELEAAVRAGFGEEIIGQQTAVITPEFTETLYANINYAVSGALSGLIVSEVGEALGIDGTVGGEIFNVAAGTVTTGFASETLGILFNDMPAGVYTSLASTGFDFSAGFYDPALDPNFDPNAFGPYQPNTTVGDYIQAQVVSALAGYAGSRLAGEVIEAESEAGALFGAVGSALGSAIGAGHLVISKALASASLVGGPIGVAIGAFIGTVIGTAFGNLFGGDDDLPQAWARIGYDADTQQYSVGANWGSDGGDASTALSMAQQVMQGVNEILETSHGKLRSGASAPGLQIGYEGNELKVIYGGDVKVFGTSADAAQYAAFKIMQGFDLVGGHAIVMRAWHNSDATNIYEWLEDIQVAEAFQNYLADPTAILALMMNDPESDLAQSWAAILQRAAELELHLPHEKDLDGGWSEILLAQGVDSAFIPDLSSDILTVTDPVTGEQTVMHHVIGPGYEIVRIEGTDGNDIIEVIVDGSSITYVDGGTGDDIIEGSDQADILYGGSGEDTINGHAGNDWLHGGAGNDTLDGGAGEDLVVGGEQNDILYGDTDTDQLYGNGGDDFIYGNDGQDFLHGGRGNDILNGGAGQQDYLYGGAGNDTLQADDADRLFGGKGDDTFQLGTNSTANIRINRLEGHDVVELSTGQHYISFHTSISMYELFYERNVDDLKIYVLGEDQSVLLKNFFSSGVNATILANTGTFALDEIGGSVVVQSDVIAAYDAGLLGDLDASYNILTDAQMAERYDWITENHGQIYRKLTSGGDYLNDAIVYSSGDDNITFNNAPSWTKRVHHGGAGDDTLIPSDFNYSGNSLNLYGDSGNDTLYGAGANDMLVGGLGNDAIYGRGGDDLIYGSHGDDYLRGGGGNDFIRGGIGDDYIEGKADDDDIYGGAGNDFIEGQDGIDLLKGDDGDDEISGGDENDVLYGGTGNDQLSGDDGDDTALGEDGDDNIDGGSGNDRLSGGAGNDILLGMSGNDTLYAGEGNDILSGGTGSDYLNGGDGDDTYILSLTDSLSRKAIAFNENGNDGYGLLNSAVVGLNNMTVSVNFNYFSVANEWNNLFQYASASNKNEFSLNFNPTFGLTINIAGGIFKPAITLAPDENHNFVVSWDSDNGIVDFYDNGILIQSFTGAYTGQLESGGSLSIAKNQSSMGVIQSNVDGLPAMVDELAVWDRALDANEVTNGFDKSDAMHDFDFGDQSQPGILVNKTGNGDMQLSGNYDYVEGSTSINDALQPDTISDSDGSDTLHIEGDFDISDIVLEKSSDNADNLLVNLLGSHLATIEGYFSSGTIEKLTFDDGSTHQMSDLAIAMTSTGNDDIFIATSAAESFNGGIGIDTVDYSNSSERVIAKLLATGEAGDALGDTYVSIENLIGSDGPNADYLEGDNNDNVFYGLGGFDILAGWGGNDTLYGGAANDHLNGGTGIDTAVYTGAYANYTVTNNGANFTITDNVGNEGSDTVEHVEKFQFADGVYENGVFTLDGGGSTNTAPIANNDDYVGDENIVLSGNLLADNGNGADNDPDGDLLNVMAVSGLATTQGGSVDITSNGNFTYTPTSGFVGSDSFSYTLEDGQGGSDMGTVTLTINAASNGNDDTFIATLAAEVFDGGDGVDTVDYSNSIERVIAKLLATGEAGDALGDTYVSIENLIGSDGPNADYLEGDNNDNVFYGLGGFDILAGWGGDDTLHGGAANDHLNGGAGIDTAVYAGAYANYTITNNGANFTITDNVGNEGSDTVESNVEKFQFADGVYENGVFTPDGGSSTNTAPIANDDNFAGDEDVAISGNVLNNNGNGVDSDPDGDPLNAVAVSGLATTQGGSVDITSDGNFSYIPATGFVGNDSFTYTLQDGQGGSNVGTVTLTINAASNGNDDTFIATPAAEVFDGGIGIDTVDYSQATERVVAKLLVGGEIGDAAGDSYISIENLMGSDGPNADYLEGDNNDNVFYGLGGYDTLSGWGGDDTLFGGDSGDGLNGGPGDDILYGEAGNDHLVGGSGADHFMFLASDINNGIDQIKDFNVSEGDKIDLSDLLAPYDPIANLITDFVQITDNGADSILSVDTDGGADNFVQIATIEGVTGLTDEVALETSGALVMV